MMIDLTGVATITLAMIVWWYVPIFLSEWNAKAAERETDLERKIELLDWAIFFHGTPKLTIQFADALFRAAQVSDNPHVRLIQTRESRKIIEELLSTDPLQDAANNLLIEIKSYEPIAEKLADAAARGERRKMRAL